MKLISLSVLLAVFFVASSGSAQRAIQWQTSPSGVFSTFNGPYLVRTSDGGYAVTGVDPQPGSINGTVTKLSSDGSTQWQTIFGGSGNNVIACLIQTDDGGYLVSG